MRCGYCGRTKTEYDDNTCKECGIDFEKDTCGNCDYIEEGFNSIDDALENMRSNANIK